MTWFSCIRSTSSHSVLLVSNVITFSHLFLVFPSGLFSSDRLCGLVVRVLGYRSRGPGFDSRRYKIFWEMVGLERGPLRLVSTIEDLLERNSGGSSLGNREYGCGDLLRWPRYTLYLKKLALSSSTSSSRSVSIVGSWTKGYDVCLFFFLVFSDFITTVSCVLKI
jgi:hypothetical protein